MKLKNFITTDLIPLVQLIHISVVHGVCNLYCVCTATPPLSPSHLQVFGRHVATIHMVKGAYASEHGSSEESEDIDNAIQKVQGILNTHTIHALHTHTHTHTRARARAHYTRAHTTLHYTTHYTTLHTCSY